ncbi:hypothetical protein HD554DRAFT_2021520 [Boletus coccyginus]|nr:hypothetical protein HD554DRAFT_2021520 [Boletus coccyginus]
MYSNPTCCLTPPIGQSPGCLHRYCNLNTVQMFSSLMALSTLNWMLISIVNLLIQHDVDLQVFHILGVDNLVADHLFYLHNDTAHCYVLGITIFSVQPP